jgi:hypothetical protein
MPLFVKPYTSDVTRFIAELKARDPSLEQRQREGRALLWDKPVDRHELASQRQSRVPQKSYVYGTQPK